MKDTLKPSTPSGGSFWRMCKKSLMALLIKYRKHLPRLNTNYEGKTPNPSVYLRTLKVFLHIFFILIAQFYS